MILAVFPLGQLVRVSLPNIPGATLQPIDLLVLFFNISWLFAVLNKKRKIAYPPAFKEMMCFAGFAFLTFLIGINKYEAGENIVGLFYLFRLFNYFLFYPVLYSFLRRKKTPVLKYLLFDGLLVGITALAQYLVIPDTRFLYYLGWDEHYYRAIGSFLDPAFTGIILVLSFQILVYLNKKKEIGRLLALGGGTILVLALGLTFSRISYAVLVLSMALWFIFERSYKKIFLGIIIFAILILLLPKPTGEGVDLWRTSSFFRRSDNYRQAVAVIKDKFWLGVGYNRYRAVWNDYGFSQENIWGESHSGAGTDNSFLLVLATTGIAGLIFYLNIWRVISLECIKQNKKGNYLLSLSVISLLLFSTVSNGLFYPWLLFWIVVLLSWSMAEN